MRHIQLNYAFLLFWSIFVEISGGKLFLLFKKKAISEMSTEIRRNFVFLNLFEKWQILRKIWICLKTFFDQTIKIVKIITKTFFLLKVIHPHTAKLCFSVVLKHFGKIPRELLFLLKKVTISEKSTEIFRTFVFPNKSEKGHILRIIWICLNNCFWSNQ